MVRILSHPSPFLSFTVDIYTIKPESFEESPLVLGATVAAAAWSGRFLIGAWQAFKARPVVPRVQRFYKGGFEQKMTRREAALILGVRESAVMEKIKEAHRRVMVANHPDAGGSHYLASKINEAKEVMSGKTKDNVAKVLPSGPYIFPHMS
ncbi:mitochondrial import inner membrane translocase subunit TIM14-3-like [Populus alba x Populus x berolinensis]|uniref:Mitochondrial import inner membrane translocase subunit TIM14-3-like n=1 Tax=Populus alba x Populus x berolinensis TaxID=444605 RepID=A0AAD6M3Q4_9ROSI|nr:mitochondrial import inner membrane translocase subunit TIM14-3-like [Populus alba x Populus x berolinensis]